MLDLKTEQLLNFDPRRAAIDTMHLMGIENAMDPDNMDQLVQLSRELDQDNKSKLYAQLRASDDVVHNTPLEEYLRIVQSLGFGEIYRKSFSPYKKLDARKWDQHIILAHYDGYIINLTTKGNWLKGPACIAEATLYHNFTVTADFMNFQHRGKAKEIRHQDGSRQYRAGSMDAHVAFRHEFTKIKNTTLPHTPWRMRPEGFHLTNASDKDGPERSRRSTKYITSERIKDLPGPIQAMIDAPWWTDAPNYGQTHPWLEPRRW